MISAQQLLDALNGLRAAVVTGFRWDLTERRVELAVADLMSGVTEMVDYRGPEPGALVFSEVVSVFMTVDPIRDALTVYEARVLDKAEGVVVVEIKFRPGGTLTVNCGAIKRSVKIEG